METKKVICIQCHNACKLDANVDENELTSVEPIYPLGHKRFTPIPKGCPRRKNVIEYVNHPDRLNYPLKRVGERGEDKWEQISWDQAFSEIGDRMKGIIDKHGPEAIASTSGTGRTTDEIRQRFLNLLGTPNHTGAGQICYGPFCVMSHVLYGWRLFPIPSKETGCVVVWGGGGPNYWDEFWRAAVKSRKTNGAKIIVIDPRRTRAAKMADLWLQIRPGTDTALALGMINYIIENELHDKEFVEEWCHGFDEIREMAAQYPLDKTSKITWVPEEQIKQAATWYATLKPGATNHGMGLEHQTNSIEALHAFFALAGVCGNVEEKGGDVFTSPYPGVIHEQDIAAHERLSPEQTEKTLGLDRFRLMSRHGFDLTQKHIRPVWGKEANARTSYEVFAHGPTIYRAILTDKPYPVRGMITLSSNPLVTVANTKLVYDAIKKLDLYVVVDFFMTPSAQLADYVLPSTTYLERPWIWAYNGLMGSERAMPKSMEGKYDRRDDFDFWRGLGLQLGQEKDWPWESLEEYYDYRLKPAGLTFQQFMDKGGALKTPREYETYKKKGFATETKRVELYSKTLENLGYDPLPIFREPPESPQSTPELAKEFPFILITGGRHEPYYHSEYRQVKSMRKMHPDPIMQLHPDTAKELGIKKDDWVWIESPRGRCKQKCDIFDGIDPRVVHAQHGWWFPEEKGAEPSLHGLWKSNINVLTDDDPEVCNKMSGGWPLRAFLCKVYKDEETQQAVAN